MSDYRKPVVKQGGDFWPKLLATFLGTLAALFVFSVCAYQYVKYEAKETLKSK
jgi:cytochrome c-type biogenesis protein CcmH/NrfG